MSHLVEVHKNISPTSICGQLISVVCKIDLYSLDRSRKRLWKPTETGNELGNNGSSANALIELELNAL